MMPRFAQLLRGRKPGFRAIYHTTPDRPNRNQKSGSKAGRIDFLGDSGTALWAKNPRTRELDSTSIPLDEEEGHTGRYDDQIRIHRTVEFEMSSQHSGTGASGRL